MSEEQRSGTGCSGAECERVYEMEHSGRAKPANAVQIVDIMDEDTERASACTHRAYRAFRRDVDLTRLGIDPESVFGTVRDRSQGRNLVL